MFIKMHVSYLLKLRCQHWINAMIIMVSATSFDPRASTNNKYSIKRWGPGEGAKGLNPLAVIRSAPQSFVVPLLLATNPHFRTFGGLRRLLKCRLKIEVILFFEVLFTVIFGVKKNKKKKGLWPCQRNLPCFFLLFVSLFVFLFVSFSPRVSFFHKLWYATGR